jgi:hypothetical protein
VAAQQLAGYAAQVKDAADASSELARRMAQAGNFSALAQMRDAVHAHEGVEKGKGVDMRHRAFPWNL